MANSRDIKNRIKSVKNTTKITRTMELIATAKAQVCQSRTQRALPYFQALAEIAGQARKAGGEETTHPLLEQRKDVKKVALLTVVGNRGLCGGYNGNVLRMARDHRQKLVDDGVEVQIIVSGKKGANWLKFQKIPYDTGRVYTQFDDKPPFAEVEKVADELVRMFVKGEVDRVDVAYTHYLSAGRQVPVVETLLPISPEEKPAGHEAGAKSGPSLDKPKGEHPAEERQVDFIIEPDPKTILDTLFPMQVKLHLFRVYLEASTSEQIARRVAMKNATDNGVEVGKQLKMAYNRARQSQITNEILEVLGGAEALA